MTLLIGYLAALLTTVCYLPQALHVLRERRTEGISLFAYTTLFGGVFCWMVYGLLLSDWPLILANAISLVFISIILAVKIRHP